MDSRNAFLSLLLFCLIPAVAGHAGTLFPPPGSGEQARKEVIAALKAGNSDALAAYLNTMVDLDIPGYRGTCGKTQGARLVRDFMSRNPFRDLKEVGSGQRDDGGTYTITELKAGGKPYRVYFVLKETSGKWLIHLLKINTI